MNCERIRSISFDNPPGLSQAALYQIAVTRPVVTLFPNLQDIAGDMDSAYFDPPYMSPSVRELIMDGEILDAKFLGSRAQQIVENMPSLTSFYFCASGRASLIEPGLCRLLEALTDLNTIHLPTNHFQPHLIYRISHLPRLRHLYFVFHGSQHQPLRPNRQFVPRPGNNAFSSLQELGLFATLREIRSLLLHDHFPTSNLTTLSLTFCDNEDLHSLRNLLENLAMTSPTLKSLAIILDHFNVPCVAFADFSSALNFPCLTEFTLCGRTEMAFSDEEAEQLASHWPHLVNLDLSPIFPLSTSCQLTLRSLAHFARYCPKLKSLRLCVDTEFDIPSHTEAYRFAALELLYLSPSPIDSSHEVARFVATSLPDTAEFYSLTNSPREPGPFGDAWQRVEETVAAMLAARKATRVETTRAMKTEIESLRKENAMLRAQIRNKI